MSDEIVPGLEENDIAALIELLDKEVGEPLLPRPEGFGITVTEYSEEKECSNDMARKVLETAIKKGIMKKEKMITGSGASPYVYFKA